MSEGRSEVFEDTPRQAYERRWAFILATSRRNLRATRSAHGPVLLTFLRGVPRTRIVLPFATPKAWRAPR